MSKITLVNLSLTLRLNKLLRLYQFEPSLSLLEWII
jgi:hypothetical protein